jgi:segregation and condensation protein B
MNTIQQKIESLLFYKNEPLSFSWLSKKLHISLDVVKKETIDMEPFYKNRGIELIFTEDKVALLTSNVAQNLITEISKSSEEKELSKQALETIAIILYSKSGITKSEIDYIRGVNSIYILRNLLIRGLIEKKENKEDRRSPLYVITTDTLSFLGIKKIDDIENFSIFFQKIKSLKDDVEE